jgi:predicted RNA-binding Zn ribbon-like protein
MAEKFQLVASHVALDYANTLDYRYDPDRLVDLLPSYERFLAFCRQSGVVPASQTRTLLANTSESDARRALKQVIEFREAFYHLILSAVSGRSPEESHLETFNEFLADVRVPDRVAWHKRGFVRGYRDVAPTSGGPLRLIVDAAAALLTSSDLHHIHECGEKSCRWLFLDRSRNHSRRWCDMGICGNRSKAQRFYARTRKGVGG